MVSEVKEELGFALRATPRQAWVTAEMGSVAFPNAVARALQTAKEAGCNFVIPQMES